MGKPRRLLNREFKVEAVKLVTEQVEFPTRSGHEVKVYSDCSYSAGETYPSDE
jgi:hypothetical protein